MISISQEDFLRLVQFVKNNYGIDLSKKKQLVEGRLHSTITKKGFTGFTEYIDYAMNNNAEEIEQLLNKLTTNHTYFMRESAHFDLFKNVILPTLEKNKKNKVLGIWSAGCSTGQEPYTLSMILKDYFMNKPGWDTRVLATDISQQALEKARAATYDAESLSDIPPAWMKKYFAKKDNHMYTLVPQIRDNVIFSEFNLMLPIRFKLKFDVIFCRNVMIYFDSPTKTALVQRFYNATNSGGYLLVGHSETLTKENNPYQFLDVAAYVKDV